MIELSDYQLQDTDRLLSPCLLVYPEYVRANLRESIRIAGGPANLRPHVKTHKTRQIVQMQLDEGIVKHKCATLMEAHLLADAGVQDILIAYPQVGPNIVKLGQLADLHPSARFATVVDCAVAAQALSSRFASAEKRIDVLIDVDTGMHRTGVAVGAPAADLFGLASELPGLNVLGLHVYDGQNHQPSLADRTGAVAQLMQSVRQTLSQIEEAGHSISQLVCGGTPTFAIFAGGELGLPDQLPVECSPGTCVLHDFNYGHEFPDVGRFRHAALMMTRVISKQPDDRLTLDLGNKAIAADPPAGQRCHLMGLSDAEELQHNEEHLVIRSAKAAQYEVGDVLYAVPAHICPTVALHASMQVIQQGRCVDSWPIEARQRFYQLD